MKTLLELIADARAQIELGTPEGLAEAERLTGQIKALKAVEELTPPTAVTPPVIRPPFAAATPPQEEETRTPEEIAVKAWSVRRFGERDKAAEQIAKEMYPGQDYDDLLYRKNGSYKRYIHTGFIAPDDYRLSKQLVAIPSQIVAIAESGLDMATVKATMIEADDTLGGFVVPEDVRMDYIQRLPGMTTVRACATVVTTSRDRITFPKVTGGDSRYRGNVRVTWVDESPTAGASATNATWGQIGIPIYTVMAKTSLSRNLVEDAGFDLEGYLGTEFPIAMAMDEDFQFLIGTGVGKPQGILNGTAASSGPFDSDIGTVTSGTAAALTGTGIVAVPYGLAAQYRQNATWVFTKATLKAISQLQDGQSRFLFRNNIDNLSSGQPKTLEGYAFSENEVMPEIHASTFPIIFGDFKGYRIADRVGMSMERYLDSTTADLNQIVYFARRRLAGQVASGWSFIAHQAAA